MDQERSNPAATDAAESAAGEGRFNRARDFVNERYGAAADSARKGYDQIRNRVGEVDLAGMTEQLRTYVRANPGKALLISVGIGFLVGLILRHDGGDDDDE